MKKMMRKHLDLTLEEAVAHLNGDWNADIKAYDKVHEEILKMADMLSAGIIKQFPKKFG
jgi:5'(3')-deoxyribonucleotidase